MRNRAVAAAVFFVSGCKLLRSFSGGDDDPAPSASVAAVVSAAPVADAAPAFANAADVKRYADETPPDTTPTAKLTHDGMRARAEVPNGSIVATLKKDQEVTTIAEHGGFVLVSFPDPKDATSTLIGWTSKGGFSATPPPDTSDKVDHVSSCHGSTTDYLGAPFNQCVQNCAFEKDCGKPCIDDYVVKDCSECTADQKCIPAQHSMEDGVGWSKACIGKGKGCSAAAPASTGFDPTAPGITKCPAGQTLVLGGASGHMPVCAKHCMKDTDCPAGSKCDMQGDPGGDPQSVCIGANHSFPL